MATGSYTIFGSPLPLEPTEANWVNRRSLGRNGSGQEILSPVFSYQLKWGLMKMSEFNSLLNIIRPCSGTYVPVSLPEYGASTYEFYAYTGCVVNTPTVDKYFSETVTNVNLMITGIGIALFRNL